MMQDGLIRIWYLAERIQPSADADLDRCFLSSPMVYIYRDCGSYRSDVSSAAFSSLPSFKSFETRVLWFEAGESTLKGRDIASQNQSRDEICV